MIAWLENLIEILELRLIFSMNSLVLIFLESMALTLQTFLRHLKVIPDARHQLFQESSDHFALVG